MTTRRKPRCGNSRRTLARELRSRIVTGVYLPGEQLPKRTELLDEFGVSTTTMQASFDLLARQGFIRTGGKAGTFVTDAPPHLTRYALIFPFPERRIREMGGWLRVMLNVAPEVARRLGVEVVPYFDIYAGSRGPDRQRLHEDCENHLVAGLLYASCPWLRDGDLVFDMPDALDIPKTAVGEPIWPGVPCVALDGEEYIRMAVDRVAATGRWRVAIICSPTFRRNELLDERIAHHGLTCHPHWHVRASTAEPVTAFDAARLLMHPGQTERPEALIIADDTLVEHACAGLAACGVSTPGDLFVLAHANFPLPPKPVLPVKFFGYDNEAIIQHCIKLLEGQRNGHPTPNRTVVPPQMEGDPAVFDFKPELCSVN